MSTLQLSLIIVGLLVIAAVMAYNAWVLRKSGARKLPSRDPATPAGQSGADAPAGQPGERLEPVLQDMGADPVPADSAGHALEDDTGLAVMPPAADRRPGLDALIDAIAPLVLEHPVSGDAVLAALPGSRRVGTKPFAVEGLQATSQEWETPRAGQRYTSLQAGVQLANRSGALNEIEFSEFVVKTQAFADAVGAAPEFPDMRHEVGRARELDQFAGAHDAQLGFTLRARRAAWSPGYVTQNAKALGFTAGALPGRMVLPDSQGHWPVIRLQFDTQAALAEDPEQSALRDISLSLDVAHVPRSERPYQRLRECALALAQRMDGVVTDDNGQPLGPDVMDRIGADLEVLYDALDAHDLSAGSPQARRLFS